MPTMRPIRTSRSGELASEHNVDTQGRPMYFPRNSAKNPATTISRHWRNMDAISSGISPGQRECLRRSDESVRPSTGSPPMLPFLMNCWKSVGWSVRWNGMSHIRVCRPAVSPPAVSSLPRPRQPKGSTSQPACCSISRTPAPWSKPQNVCSVPLTFLNRHVERRRTLSATTRWQA